MKRLTITQFSKLKAGDVLYCIEHKNPAYTNKRCIVVETHEECGDCFVRVRFDGLISSLNFFHWRFALEEEVGVNGIANKIKQMEERFNSRRNVK